MDIPHESGLLYRACQEEAEPARTDAYRRLGQLLYRVAWQRVGHDPALAGLAEEAMQESLVIVWRQLSLGRGPAPESFIPWATAILVNKVREGLRRLEPTGRSRPTRRVAASRQVSLDAPAAEGEAPLSERLAAEEAPAEEALAYEELCALIVQIREMPEISAASRTVLLRGFIEGLDDGELAEALGTSRANVHVIRCRDLAKLRAVAPFMASLRSLAGDET